MEGSGLSAKSQDRILAQFAEALEENFETKVTAAIEPKRVTWSRCWAPET